MTTEENTTRFIEASDKIRKVFVAMEGFTNDISLSKPELLTLESVSKQKELTMSKLAKNLDIGFSTATSIIDRLIEKNLVVRERNGGDRRVVKVFLSKEGEKIMSSYQEQTKISFKKMIEFLTEDEQECFILVLEKIANKMQK
jgi:DNA-binding MarR family transcriptional regulator